MIEIGDGTSFSQVGFGVRGLSDELSVRDLDGHEPLQLVVVGEVDEAEAAPAQHLLDPVATDLVRKCGRGVSDGGCVHVTRPVCTRIASVVHELDPSATGFSRTFS